MKTLLSILLLATVLTTSAQSIHSFSVKGIDGKNLNFSNFNRFDNFENGMVDIVTYDSNTFEQVMMNVFDKKTVEEIHEKIITTHFSSNITISHRDVSIIDGKYNVLDNDVLNECIVCKTNETFFFKKMGISDIISSVSQLFCPSNLKLYILFNQNKYNYDKKILMFLLYWLMISFVLSTLSPSTIIKSVCLGFP
jgi:hypothetical protein